MRTLRLSLAVLSVFLLVNVTADATPLNDHKLQYLEPLASPRPSPPPMYDGDRDGFLNNVDCNDDDPLVYPGAEERRNGQDDDCDGVVDNGFDTTMDWPHRSAAARIWPDANSAPRAEWLSLDSAPRVVWTGAEFIAVWEDLGERVRIARVAADGTLLDNPPAVLALRARFPDIAWTGSRLGIVYEDRSDGLSTVRFAAYSPDGTRLVDTTIATNATQPRIAWGQDRFGIVWREAYCAGSCLVFQRFDADGRIIGAAQSLEHSGHNAAIAWSGTGVTLRESGYEVHPGRFGVVYEAYYAFAASGDVRLAVLSADPYGESRNVTVNQHSDPYSALGARPSVAGNSSGFAVSWHVVENGADAGCTRFFSVDSAAPTEEFAPDTDAAVSAGVLWTGGEFVLVNENLNGNGSTGSDIHFRRMDPTGNPHRAAEWGPWSEVALSLGEGGATSARPAAAGTGATVGAIWIEQHGSDDFGWLHFALVAGH